VDGSGVPPDLPAQARPKAAQAEMNPGRTFRTKKILEISGIIWKAGINAGPSPAQL